ncbi:MAG: TIGR02757 family protein [Candidatus Riflebacteria bacterium]|nr:TIGR02757 family protein [Candidatus Riflebacteria bacterium]
MDIKKKLDKTLALLDIAAETAHDPVSFPRRFLALGRSRQEIEAVAFFSAALAYGSVDQFMPVIARVLAASDDRFLDLIMNRLSIPVWPGYRLSTNREIAALARGIGRVIERRGGLWESFAAGWKPDENIHSGLASLRSDLARETEEALGEPLTQGARHLLPDPSLGGCVKRLCIFLRWVARPDDGVDLGIWREIPGAALVVPLDRHIARLSRNLGLLTRRTDDWKAAVEITDALRRFDPVDPLRYDFALCHLGISKSCTHGRNPDDCRSCGLAGLCLQGNSAKR